MLQAEAYRVEAAAQAASAQEIEAQVEQMRGRIERHLAVVRLRGPAGGAAALTPVRATLVKLVKLVRAMRTSPRGTTIVMVTHDPRILDLADRIVTLEERAIVRDAAAAA